MISLNKSTVVAIGVFFVVLGIAGLAEPYFTTSSVKDIIQLGDMKVQTMQTTPHTVPQEVAGGAVLLGLVLAGVGVAMRARPARLL